MQLDFTHENIQFELDQTEGLVRLTCLGHPGLHIRRLKAKGPAQIVLVCNTTSRPVTTWYFVLCRYSPSVNLNAVRIAAAAFYMYSKNGADREELRRRTIDAYDKACASNADAAAVASTLEVVRGAVKVQRKSKFIPPKLPPAETPINSAYRGLSARALREKPAFEPLNFPQAPFTVPTQPPAPPEGFRVPETQLGQALSQPPAPTKSAMVNQFNVARMLDENFDAETGRFAEGWDDERIAKETGAALFFVRNMREANMGPLRAPSHFQKFEDDLKTLKSMITTLQEEYEAEKKKHNWR